jgi:hypothetical protein
MIQSGSTATATRKTDGAKESCEEAGTSGALLVSSTWLLLIISRVFRCTAGQFPDAVIIPCEAFVQVSFVRLVWRYHSIGSSCTARTWNAVGATVRVVCVRLIIYCPTETRLSAFLPQSNYYPTFFFFFFFFSAFFLDWIRQTATNIYIKLLILLQLQQNKTGWMEDGSIHR